MTLDIAHNLASLRARIAQAEQRAGRAPGSVKLIAVSKFHPLSAVQEAIAAGQTCFGENRVQEAKEKFLSLRQTNPALEVHLIGPLQTNKAAEAVRLFDVIQTLDRASLAQALAKAMRATGKRPRLYVEVNLGREAQKAGVLPEALDDFLRRCRDEEGLEVEGLMCIPPHQEDPAPHFATLRAMAERLALPNVSMGMSDDFETAIRQGATQVRVGTALFGARPYS